MIALATAKASRLDLYKCCTNIVHARTDDALKILITLSICACPV
jgi:hypothetical protein